MVACLIRSGEYSYEGDKREDGGLLFVRGSGSFRTAHVHVVGSSSEAWRLYLRFHRLLLADAAARGRYQTDKHSLARRFPNDRLRYTNGKRAVIEELLNNSGDGPTAH